LTPEKVAQYASLFERQPLQGNMLPGEQAKQIFEKSGLPNEVLGRIWMLADTEQRGALVLTEFVIAMHLLTSMKTGALRGLPNILPAALYEAATRRAHIGPSAPRQQSPTTATPPISAVPKQVTGPTALPQMRTGSPLAPPPVAAQSTGDWLVTAADKARFDQLFDELDKAKKGFITGEEAVGFFSQSNLSEDILAQIWDLADINSEGRLSRDEFAVAMYLIRQLRSKRDGPMALPATLPPNLVPPSMRAQPRSQPAIPAFEPAPRPQPKPSALDDLFGLDNPQPPAPAQVPIGTGGSAGVDPFATGMSPAAPSSPARPSPSTSTFKPFVPSSSFGRGLTAQVTGGSNTSATTKPAPVLASTAEDDLLGDNEPEISKTLNNETTELANLSNQIGSLTKQVQDVQAQRTATQNELTQANAQKKNFEQRLAQLRAMYEKEAQDVRSLETQLATSKNETKKLQAEFAMVDASYQELTNQHRQILTSLQADQQENANLKEKIRMVNAEISQLKPQIEKLKSEARQQRGLVAINKKQLATNEGERDKLRSEVEDLTKSNEELARQLSSSPPPPTQVASPALSAASGNNPFFRRTGSTDVSNTFSPPIRSFTDKTFDDVFGPVGPGTQSGTPPTTAAAVYKHNTGTSTGSAGSFATPASTSPNVSRQPTVAAEPSAPAFPSFSENANSLGTPRQVSPPLSRTETNHELHPNANATPIEPAPTGQSAASGSGSEPTRASVTSATEVKPGSNAFGAIAEESHKGSLAGNESDPFAIDQKKAKEDFESAFASFKQAKAGATSSNDTATAFSRFDTEFPPISELERDDESDSESERGGFDDDFAPASPTPKLSEKAAESRSASPTVSKSSPDAAAAAASTASSEQPATRYDNSR
jgi:epidermal growth factor receptor substrate 15